MAVSAKSKYVQREWTFGTNQSSRLLARILAGADISTLIDLSFCQRNQVIDVWAKMGDQRRKQIGNEIAWLR